jgi:endoglucanase
MAEERLPPKEFLAKTVDADPGSVAGPALQVKAGADGRIGAGRDEPNGSRLNRRAPAEATSPLRRRTLGMLAAGLIASRPDVARARSRQQWLNFRARFITADGRVVDSGNAGVSHSEGQGWGLLLALAHDDRATFRMLYNWTRRALARPSDSLLSWRFRPGHQPAVDDPNNATDGDLYVAWALARAGEKWNDQALVSASARMGRDVLSLTREIGRRLVLLPGATGFENVSRIVVNPSYLVLPAFAVLDRVVPDPRWRRVSEDGLDILRQARFGRWDLPPDWLALPRGSGPAAPAEGWPPRFSYDAVRVPLLLAWAGHAAEPAVSAALRFWRDPAHRAPPAWADLRTGAVAEYAASGGVQAIAEFAANAVAGRNIPVESALQPADDYYSATLKMLVLVATTEAFL